MYVTDSLYSISGNTSEVSSEGTKITKRYMEMIEMPNEPQKQETAEEIVNRILKQLKEGADEE